MRPVACSHVPFLTKIIYLAWISTTMTALGEAGSSSSEGSKMDLADHANDDSSTPSSRKTPPGQHNASGETITSRSGFVKRFAGDSSNKDKGRKSEEKGEENFYSHRPQDHDNHIIEDDDHGHPASSPSNNSQDGSSNHDKIFNLKRTDTQMRTSVSQKNKVEVEDSDTVEADRESDGEQGGAALYRTSNVFSSTAAEGEVDDDVEEIDRENKPPLHLSGSMKSLFKRKGMWVGCTTSDHMLHGIDLESGKTLFRYRFGQPLISSSLQKKGAPHYRPAPDGSVYFTTDGLSFMPLKNVSIKQLVANAPLVDMPGMSATYLSSTKKTVIHDFSIDKHGRCAKQVMKHDDDNILAKNGDLSTSIIGDGEVEYLADEFAALAEEQQKKINVHFAETRYVLTGYSTETHNQLWSLTYSELHAFDSAKADDYNRFLPDTYNLMETLKVEQSTLHVSGIDIGTPSEDEEQGPRVIIQHIIDLHSRILGIFRLVPSWRSIEKAVVQQQTENADQMAIFEELLAATGAGGGATTSSPMIFQSLPGGGSSGSDLSNEVRSDTSVGRTSEQSEANKSEASVQFIGEESEPSQPVSMFHPDNLFRIAESHSEVSYSLIFLKQGAELLTMQQARSLSASAGKAILERAEDSALAVWNNDRVLSLRYEISGNTQEHQQFEMMTMSRISSSNTMQTSAPLSQLNGQGPLALPAPDSGPGVAHPPRHGGYNDIQFADFNNDGHPAGFNFPNNDGMMLGMFPRSWRAWTGDYIAYAQRNKERYGYTGFVIFFYVAICLAVMTVIPILLAIIWSIPTVLCYLFWLYYRSVKEGWGLQGWFTFAFQCGIKKAKISVNNVLQTYVGVTAFKGVEKTDDPEPLLFHPAIVNPEQDHNKHFLDGDELFLDDDDLEPDERAQRELLRTRSFWQFVEVYQVDWLGKRVLPQAVHALVKSIFVERSEQQIPVLEPLEAGDYNNNHLVSPSSSTNGGGSGNNNNIKPIEDAIVGTVVSPSTSSSSSSSSGVMEDGSKNSKKDEDGPRMLQGLQGEHLELVPKTCSLYNGLENTRLFQRYDVFEQLGAGGFGTVWRCQPKLENAAYAVKIIKYKFTEEQTVQEIRAKFTEVSNSRMMTHKNIVRYFGCWAEEAQFLPLIPEEKKEPAKLKKKDSVGTLTSTWARSRVDTTKLPGALFEDPIRAMEKKAQRKARRKLRREEAIIAPPLYLGKKPKDQNSDAESCKYGEDDEDDSADDLICFDRGSREDDESKKMKNKSEKKTTVEEENENNSSETNSACPNTGDLQTGDIDGDNEDESSSELVHSAHENSEEVRAREARDAENKALLANTSISKVRYDICLCLQMEYINGPNLRQWLQDDRRSTYEGRWTDIQQFLPEEQYHYLTDAEKFRFSNMEVDFALQLVKAVHHIHANHIVHRDLKPTNCFVDMNQRTLKIGDFGLAAERKDDPDAKYFNSNSMSALDAIDEASDQNDFAASQRATVPPNWGDDFDSSSDEEDAIWQRVQRGTQGRADPNRGHGGGDQQTRKSSRPSKEPVSEALSRALSFTMPFMGTQGYIPPEGTSRYEYGDIFSLACVLIELLSPRMITHHERSTVMTAFRQEGKIPAHIVAELPLHAELLKRMRSENPRERPSAREVYARLREWQKIRMTVAAKKFFDEQVPQFPGTSSSEKRAAVHSAPATMTLNLQSSSGSSIQPQIHRSAPPGGRLINVHEQVNIEEMDLKEKISKNRKRNMFEPD